ncbi:TaqI-like C-terminal specificity domain-containing protein [Butyrivibrio sp.]|uniref:TaqI-like C-terminal specificity domain-containing protein n=1 Tax=Butyrivibrio sp. TaxID=28121 RepID=UPI0025C540AB|nr:TaqI-like C-terminal specificity domain-containing protein [Butyrivibrio sp.]
MKTKNLTPRQAGDIMGVSPATVLNWIKLGRLSATKSNGRYYIDETSFNSFSGDLAGSGLLQSRRNKSLHNSNYVPNVYIDPKSVNLKTVKALIEHLSGKGFDLFSVLALYSNALLNKALTNNAVVKELSLEPAKALDSELLELFPLKYIKGEDTLGLLYLSLRRLSDKKKSGSYYTPFFAVDTLVSSIDIEGRSVFDPACGTGNFLLRLPDDHPLSAVYGSDIDEIAVRLTRINLAMKYGVKDLDTLDIIKKNIVVRDFIFSDDFPFCDILLGNPPWGYGYSSEESGRLKELYLSAQTSGKPESFSLFIEKALKVVSRSGSISFLLPETLLDADFHEDIRTVIMQKSHVQNIHYLNEIFEKVQCPCIILTLKKACDRIIDVYKYQKKRASLLLVDSYSVPADRISKQSFHVLANNEEYEVLKKIRSAQHFTLKDKADFALGIVTGSNKAFLTDTEKTGYEGILKGKDIHKYYADNPGSYISFTPDKFQQVAPVKYYRAKEKLIYKFIANEPVFAYDNKCMLTLNSANIVIPKVPDYSALYIMAILNSPVMSFYYRHTYKSVKVLRSAIEDLPIACCDPQTMTEISELAMKITLESAQNSVNIEQLNNRILELYGISANELENT